MPWFKTYKQRVQKNKHKASAPSMQQNHREAVGFLTPHQWHQLEAVISTQQWELFAECLLPFMGKLYAIAKNNDNANAYLDARLTQCVTFLRALAAESVLSEHAASEPALGNAITAFGVLRIFLKGIASVWEAPQKNAVYFLKRLPPNLRLHLTPDSYRLYELHGVLFGALETLTLNADIAKWLTLAEEGLKKVSTPSDAKETGENNRSNIEKESLPLVTPNKVGESQEEANPESTSELHFMEDCFQQDWDVPQPHKEATHGE